MPVMDRDVQEVEVLENGLMTDADADIAVRGRHVRRHVKRNRERLSLLQNIHDAL